MPLQLLGPDIPFNNGCFRVVQVVAPRGCLLNPVAHAPCFGGVMEVSIRIVDAILGALAPVARDRVGAGSYGTCINFSGGGFDAERGASYGFYFFIEGGWGACAWRDGWNCTPNPTSNFTDYPVEWIESTLPLRYLEARLNTDSGGAGLWRGGVGTVRTVLLLANSVEINGLGERFLIPPYGLDGGDPGGGSALLTRNADEAEWATVAAAKGSQSPSKFHGFTYGMGTQFKIMTGGGGGYGAPLHRPADRVLRDVIEGFVSRQAARDDYGVVLTDREDGTLHVDVDSTSDLRHSLLGKVRSRQESRTRIVQNAMARSAGILLSDEAQRDIAMTEERIATMRQLIDEQGLRDDEAAPGKSLRNPFLNERALQFWGNDSMDRWLSRHGVDVARGK